VIVKIPIKTKIIIMNRDDFIISILSEAIDTIFLFNNSVRNVDYFNNLAVKASIKGIEIKIGSNTFLVKITVSEETLFKKFLELAKILKREEFTSANSSNIYSIFKDVLDKFKNYTLQFGEVSFAVVE
jgi:hypothetical protein